MIQLVRPRPLRPSVPVPLSLFGLSGEYLAQAIRPDGSVRQEVQGKNLILNSGLDILLNTSVSGLQFGNVMLACRSGTGSTAAANTDTALGTPRLTTTTVLTGSPNGSTYDTVSGGATHTRVFNFAAEASGVTINEIGIAPATTGNLFSRFVLATPVTMVTGDNLRVTYSLSITCPLMITAATVTGFTSNGFDVSGTMRLCGNYIYSLSNIASTGVTSGIQSVLFDPVGFGTVHLLSNSALNTLNAGFTPTYAGTSAADSQGTVTASTYVSGNYWRDITCAWTSIIPAAGTVIARSICFYRLGNQLTGGDAGIFHVFSANQTKTNTQTLSITYRVTVGRV